jgi:hypothetical protein
MLPILAPERMADLLANELVGLGFERTGDTCTRTDPDGVEIVVDLKAATISVRLGADRQLAEQVELEVRAAEERAEAVHRVLRGEARDELEARVAEQTASAQRVVTATLEAKLGELKRELDRAIGSATVAALTEKAAQLGHIEETHADEAGNVTIRVRI